MQVCYDTSHAKTIKRETDALAEASEELGCQNLLIITWDKEEVINKDELKIQLTPAYKWLTGMEERERVVH